MKQEKIQAAVYKVSDFVHTSAVVALGAGLLYLSYTGLVSMGVIR